jgi:hypothetical protein
MTPIKFQLEVKPRVIGLFVLASGILSVLKFLGVINWPLVWILAPIWIPFTYDSVLSIIVISIQYFTRR